MGKNKGKEQSEMINTIMDFINRVLKKRYILLVLITAVVFGAGGVLYSTLISSRQKSMIIEFNYPGSEKGLNPDGSMFNMSELKSPDVIEKAKEHLVHKDIDTEFLRSRIFVTPKLSDQSVESIVSAVQDEKNLVYMPTSFYVYYTQKNKFSKNESDVFMEGMAQAYTEYFNEKYSEKNDILRFDPNEYDFGNTDYIEIHRFFKNRVESMLSYIKTHQSENKAFHSKENVNLGMAAKKLESFRDTSLERFYAYIVQNGISKDNHEYVKSLNYLIYDETIGYKKMIEGSDIKNTAVSKYDPAIAAVAFVPSVDIKRNYYMSRTKTGIDDLIKQSYDDGMTAAKTLGEIKYYDSLWEKFSVTEKTGDSSIVSADEMIQLLSSDLAEISNEILEIYNEYLKSKTENYFTIRLPEKYKLSYMRIIKLMLAGVILAVAMIIFNEYIKKQIFNRLRVLEEAFESVELVKKSRRK